MKIFIDLNYRYCQIIRTPVQISLIPHFVFKLLVTDIKFQVMMSFCLQITRIMYGKIGASDL